MSIDAIYMILPVVAIPYLSLPPIIRRIIGKFGVQVIAYIKSSKIQEAYSVGGGLITFDRVDVKVLVVEKNGNRFSAKKPLCSQ